MKCPNCFNIILTTFKCRYCSNNFCSLSCLEIHFINNHNNINNINHNYTNISNNNTNNNNSIYSTNTKISNPFLTKGILNNSIMYDSIYSLKNFIPVYEQDGRLKIIGSGSYGQVYLGLNIITKKYYAIKHMDKKNIYSLLHSLSGIQKEIEIQSKIDHPNIVKLLYVKETDLSYDLIMEYAPGGNLFHFIRKAKGLNENISFHLFIQVVNAIYFLHENDLIHRDIKPENILMFENNIVKLCDFGWCVKLNGKQRGTFCGTTEYMSPELVNRSGYGKEIDVWSLGVLLYEMIHGYSPFRPNKINFDEKDVMENIINHNINFEKNISEECKNLIYGLLEPNINKRYKVEDIYNSQFVKKYEQILFGLQNDNYNLINNIQTQNQINNILYSPQVGMNNNINIHMSMDMTNYVYNIQIPEKKKFHNYNQKSCIRVRNQSFPKFNKGIYSNYINSLNKQENHFNYCIGNNNYMNSNIDNNIRNYSNNSPRIFNKRTILNDKDKNISYKKKLNPNKTWDNFYPINLGKNREQEIIDIYSAHNNDILENDNKRDNKDFINFNNPIIYLSTQNDNIFNNDNNYNQNNNNIWNNISQLNSINSSQYSHINYIKETEGNNLELLNIENDNLSNISKHNNIINNTNFKNYNEVITNYSNNSHFPSVQLSLIKRMPIIQNNNNNAFNYNLTNSLINNTILNTNNKNASISTIPTVSTKIISEDKNKIIENPNNLKNNNFNLINRTNITPNKNLEISKISEFEIEEKKQYLNNQKENKNKFYNLNLNMEIDPYDYSNNKMNIEKYSNESNIYFQDKNINKIKIEKEPIDNIFGKKKIKTFDENINIPAKINNKDNAENTNFILYVKSKEISNLKQSKTHKNIGNLKEQKKKKRKINKNKNSELKKLGIPFYKKISFDQPKLLVIKEKEKESNRHFPKSKSFCENDIFQKMKNYKNKNKNNINKNYNKKNLTNNKRNNKKENIIKYLYKQKNNNPKLDSNKDSLNKNKTEQNIENIIKKETKDLDNSFSDASCSIFNVVNSKKEKIDKINKKKIKYNIINTSHPIINNKISDENSLIGNTSNKRPKNNKNYNIKKDIISMNPNKMKLQKNVKTENNYKFNFIRFTPNSKSFININKNNNRNGIKLEINQLENNKSEANIMKYLKINKTSDERHNKIKGRCDYTNNNINKEGLNLIRKENKLLLRPINSFRNINNDNQLFKINSININAPKLKLNQKYKSKDISSDYKNKKKIKFKNDISIKDTDSNIINNTSDFNDTNDERNITPKKKSIFNKVKPNKLLEAFKKELAEGTKKII